MNKATLIEWQKAKVLAQSITTTTTATIITTIYNFHLSPPLHISRFFKAVWCLQNCP